MSAVKVYQHKKYDHAKGAYVVAHRMATREFVAMAGSEIIEGTEREIEGSFIDEDGQATADIQPWRKDRPRGGVDKPRPRDAVPEEPAAASTAEPLEIP